jgi:hypothetical protein
VGILSRSTRGVGSRISSLFHAERTFALAGLRVDKDDSERTASPATQP